MDSDGNVVVVLGMIIFGLMVCCVELIVELLSGGSIVMVGLFLDSIK